MRYVISIALLLVLGKWGAMAQGFQPGPSQTINQNFNFQQEPVNRGLQLLIGPKVNYYKGTGPTPLKPYDENRISFQADAQLGYVFNQRRAARGNFLGAFAAAGMQNYETMSLLFEDQDLPLAVLDNKSHNIFYQLEVGMYIAEFIRVSGGVGRQHFDVVSGVTAQKNSSGNNGNGNGNGGNISGTTGLETEGTVVDPKHVYVLQYYTTTVGIKINLGAVDWVFDVNWMFGGDFDNLVARPSTGFYVKF